MFVLRIFDFDLTLTLNHTFSNPKAFHPESNTKTDIPLKHDGNEFTAIATFHNDPEYVLRYIAHILKIDRNKIDNHGKPVQYDDDILHAYTIPGQKMPLVISTIIPEDDPEDYYKHLQNLRVNYGKNKQIEHILDYLQRDLKDLELTGENCVVEFYDDSGDNVEKAQNILPDLINRRYLVNKFSSEFLSTDPDKAAYTEDGKNEFYDAPLPDDIFNSDSDTSSPENTPLNTPDINRSEAGHLLSETEMKALILEKLYLKATIIDIGAHAIVLRFYGAETKGSQLLTLHHDLMKISDDFWSGMEKDGTGMRSSITVEDFNSFQEKFKKRLHQDDAIMNKHRQIWKPIIANLLMALSGIGLIIMAAKAESVIKNASAENRMPGFREFFFFAKTKSQLKIESIDDALADCQNTISTPAA